MTDFKIADPFLRRMVYAVGIMGMIAFGFYTFNLLNSTLAFILNVLTPFIMALLLAYIFAPIVIALQQRLKLGRIMGTLVLYLIIFHIILLLLVVIIPKVVSEFIKMFQAIKEYLPVFVEKMSKSEIVQLDERVILFIQEKVKAFEIKYEDLANSVLPTLKNMASGGIQVFGAATKGFFSGVGSMIGFFSFLVFVGIINFYFIIDWEKIDPMIRKMIPPQHRERVFDVLNKVDIAVGGFLRGQLTVCIIVGSLFAAGLFVMGFFGFPELRNYSVLIGTAAAIGGFIPYLGAIIGVTPGLLIILFNQDATWNAKFFGLFNILLLFSIIQAIEGFILQPKIVGKGAGLHPLVVMLALIVGAQFGIGGMIVSVPLASVIRVLVREFYWIPIEEREARLSEQDVSAVDTQLKA